MCLAVQQVHCALHGLHLRIVFVAVVATERPAAAAAGVAHHVGLQVPMQQFWTAHGTAPEHGSYRRVLYPGA